MFLSLDSRPCFIHSTNQPTATNMHCPCRGPHTMYSEFSAIYCKRPSDVVMRQMFQPISLVWNQIIHAHSLLRQISTKLVRCNKANPFFSLLCNQTLKRSSGLNHILSVISSDIQRAPGIPGPCNVFYRLRLRE